jgi:ADP-ribose pyrophosphatase
MKWEILKHKLLYQGFFRLEQYRLRYDKFEGGSNTIEREIFERGNAVAVLPYDPAREAVVLIEQFRPGAVLFGGSPWLLELIAGMLEPDETPEEVVRREALEEAGCVLEDVFPLHRYLASPGGSTECITLYAARTDTSKLKGGIHGLDEEHEDIKVHIMGVDHALSLLNSGQINNATTILGLQWLALNHGLLRDRWSV